VGDSLDTTPFPMPLGGWDPFAVRPAFGTYRGWVRLLLAQGGQLMGQLREYQAIDWNNVDRIVFVCRGNICRSAYAAAVAAQQGIPASSFGLAASTGREANVLALREAAGRGIDLSTHRACDVRDFRMRPGDLFAAMEVRQARTLKQWARPASTQTTLLGLWSRQLRPHIHDPHRLSDDYLRRCFDVIDLAISNIAGRLRSR
jgi:protein-tyrosine phosphatase